MKPFYVAAFEGVATPTPYTIDLTDPSQIVGPASVLAPSSSILTRIQNHAADVSGQQAVLDACKVEYLEALRSRYGRGGRKADFESLIKNPMLIVGVGCPLPAMTWEMWAIDVLLILAKNQGRTAMLIGRVLPTLFPRQMAEHQQAEVSPF